MECYLYSNNTFTNVTNDSLKRPDTITMNFNGIFLDYVELSNDFSLFASNNICKIFTYALYPETPINKYYVYFEKFDVLVAVDGGFLGLNSFSKEIQTFISFLSSLEFPVKEVEKSRSIISFIEQWKLGKKSELEFFKCIPFGIAITEKDLYKLYSIWAKDLYYKIISRELFFGAFIKHSDYQQISAIYGSEYVEQIFIYKEDEDNIAKVLRFKRGNGTTPKIEIETQVYEFVSASDWFKILFKEDKSQYAWGAFNP